MDLDRGIVRVVATLQPVEGGESIPAEPKSASSRRDVPIGAGIVECLRVRQQMQRQERLAAGASWVGGELGIAYVFTSAVGRTVPPSRFAHAWSRLLGAIGAEQVPFHATRHSASSLMLLAHVNPKLAAKRLGHATAAITLDRYSHSTDEMEREAAMSVERLITG